MSATSGSSDPRMPAAELAFEQLERVHDALSVDLVMETGQALSLLVATDLYPLGGLYSGPWAELAVRRYTRYWLPLLLAQSDAADREALVPPLDVALVWLLHRASDIDAYVDDCNNITCSAGVLREPELLAAGTAQALAFSDGSSGVGEASSYAWQEYAALEDCAPSGGRWGNHTPATPPQPFWPPQLPVAPSSSGVGSSRSSGGPSHRRPPAAWEVEMQSRLQASLPRAAWLLRRLTQAGFGGSRAELEAAVERYYRFLLLAQRYQYESLLFPPDVQLVWWAHKAHNSAYLADMDLLMGCPFDMAMPDPADDPEAARRTADLYEEEYGLPYDMSYCTAASAAPVSGVAPSSCDTAEGSCSGLSGGPTALTAAAAAPSTLQDSIARWLAPVLLMLDSSTVGPIGWAGNNGKGGSSGAQPVPPPMPSTPPLHAPMWRRASVEAPPDPYSYLQHTQHSQPFSQHSQHRRSVGSSTPSQQGPGPGPGPARLRHGLSSPLTRMAGALMGLPRALRRQVSTGTVTLTSEQPQQTGGLYGMSAAALAAARASNEPLPSERRRTLLAEAEAAAAAGALGACTASNCTYRHTETGAVTSSITEPDGANGQPSQPPQQQLSEPLVVPLSSEVLAIFHMTAQGSTCGPGSRQRNGGVALRSSIGGGSSTLRACPVPRAGATLRYLVWLAERELPAALAAAEAGSGGGGGGGAGGGATSGKGWGAGRRLLAKLGLRSATASASSSGSLPRSRSRSTSGSGSGSSGDAKLDKAVAKALARSLVAAAAGFSSLRNLPMSSDHPFWADACPGAVALAGLCELEGGAGAAGGPGGGAPGLQVRPSPQLQAVLRGEAWAQALAKAVAQASGSAAGGGP
ncbi:hypothetical protein HYH03_013844 [Edaphochlamys debaryana]|uniref:Uncharacterized protein n=1 Tax=Edaphochlamys debaryana TaxID=47281 RepID=A0A835XVE5_9CHLO|nr:hypothetical protein HYH03_013844 [Edaphochlamys debaryana]|eukprot:KAG2487565.1 hypothetical protein HYH03_013844 [Edaphochlamys debaryana]